MIHPLNQAAYRLYSLLRVYLSIALGAFIVMLLYGLVTLNSKVSTAVILALIIIFLVRGIMVTRLLHPRQLRFSGTARLSPKEKIKPPAFPQYILRCFLPLKLHDQVLSDLHELYSRRYKKYGQKKYADLWFWWEAIRSIPPLLITLCRVSLRRVIKRS